jgi:hypothetical protein
MQEIGWLAGTTSLQQAHDSRPFPEALRRAARGETPMAEVLLTLAQYQEEQAQTAAELLERERWALTAILERSAPIWEHLPDPTLRFVLDHRDGSYLEVGCFSRLSALNEPSADEQALIDAKTPCWARVVPAPQRAGQVGAPACCYVQVSTAEAIEALGFDRIMAQVEAAMRAAGQGLLAQAQVQRERKAQVARVERMLSLEPEPPAALLGRSKAMHTCLVLLLLGSVSIGRLIVGGAVWALVVLLASFLFGIPHPMILPLLIVGLAPVSLYLGARRAARSDWGEP